MAISMAKTAALAVAGLSLLLGACAGNGAKQDTAQVADDYYEAHHEGRIYVFDDAATYKEFLALGETAFRKVRIGAGPHGETVVFGLTAEDKKKKEGIASIDMYDGKLQPGSDFYGEVHSEGRIYVFGSWADLKGFKQVGEAPLRYTAIGAGPRGETVVYVLNAENKKHKPLGLMARFEKLHAKG